MGVIWEYKLARLICEDADDAASVMGYLQEVGADGWELVSVSVVGMRQFAWFKRQRPKDWK